MTMAEALVVEAINRGMTWDKFKGLLPMLNSDELKAFFEAKQKELKEVK